MHIINESQIYPAYILEICITSSYCRTKSHYPERASTLDIKHTAVTRFGHNDVVIDLFIETRFLHLTALLSNFSKLVLFFKVSLNHNNLASCEKYHKLCLLSSFTDD